MPHCLCAWQHREQMFAVGHFPILTNSLTLQIFCNINLYTHINISSMNASSCVYIDVVIIWTMMSFYQQIFHTFSCCKVLCIGNLAYAGHFAVSPSTHFACWTISHIGSIYRCVRVTARGLCSFIQNTSTNSSGPRVESNISQCIGKSLAGSDNIYVFITSILGEHIITDIINSMHIYKTYIQQLLIRKHGYIIQIRLSG